MALDGFYVEQTLHGYSNGHRLLQASVELSVQDSKKMMILSDLSGNEFVKGFERYFTGYNLDKDHVVLACTWYAEEMKRPGCVWTHSLIFNIDDLLSMETNSFSVLEMFKKPEKDDNFLSYSDTLKVKRSSPQKLDEINLKYLIWCIWGNKKPLVIFDDFSANLENELIFLFLAQHDILDEDFSFCTGSVSLRGFEGNPLHIQVVPNKISRSKLLIGEKAYEARNKNIIKNFPLWVDKMFDSLKKDSMKKYKKFVAGFSKEYKQPMYVSSLMKLYAGSHADVQKANLVTLLKMASAIFEDNKQICNEIVLLYSKEYFADWCIKDNYVETLHFFIDNAWLDISPINLDLFVILGYKFDYIGSKNLFRDLIKKEETSANEVMLKKYADIVPANQFADFTELEYERCSTLISIKNEFALCEGLWKKSKNFQQGIVRCLNHNEKSVGRKIIQMVLQTSDYDLAYDLYKIYENECIPLYWDFLLCNQKSKKIKGMLEIVKCDTSGGVSVILSNLDKKDSLLLLISVVDSYDKEILTLSTKDITKIFKVVMETEPTDSEREILARFLLPICILENEMVDIEIAKFSFDIVNGLLATQTFPENEWEKLEKILPEVASYYNWDRCRRLRKGFREKGYPFIEKENS